MSKVLRVTRNGQGESLGSRQGQGLPEDLSTRIAVIQALIPLGLEAVEDALKEEVERLAGPRYVRHLRTPGHVRWSKERGAVYLLDQKVPIAYQRVRDQRRNTDVPLATYHALQHPRAMDEGLLRRVLLGLSCRRYRECAEAIPQAFGLSASSVSRRFIHASARKLRALQERRLAGYDLVALVLDGKTCADDAMVIALGVTLSGQKVVLGFVQTATENTAVCAAFLREPKPPSDICPGNAYDGLGSLCALKDKWALDFGKSGEPEKRGRWRGIEERYDEERSALQPGGRGIRAVPPSC